MQKRKQLRLKNYNYSQNGMYFVTICTRKKKYFFGKVVDGDMKLNVVGKVVKDVLLNILKHNKDVRLDKFVIMPNHIHCIIEIVVDGHDRPLQQQSAQTLPNIIRGFKSAVTKEINTIYPNNNFEWQRSYYDHVIRKEESLQKIKEYSLINPQKWEKDELFVKV